MKLKVALLSSLLLMSSAFANTLNLSRADIQGISWVDMNLSDQRSMVLSDSHKFQSANVVAAYKLPANQGALKIRISSPVIQNKTVFVPNVLVLDANFNPSVEYPASQFQFQQERGLAAAQYQTELNLTPTPNQDFVYLVVYTTDQDLQGTSTVTHPAKLLAKAQGNQPPSIPDLTVQHTLQGKLDIEVDGAQSTQFIGLGGPLFEMKKSEPAPQVVGTASQANVSTSAVQSVAQPTVQPQPVAKPKPVEQSTEAYFNQAVLDALKNNDVNKAMNLVNEAERLGLEEPRKIFIKNISIQK
ncbi:MalM family protein [Otariodibacter oris]|uniref:Maltose operon protein n=1 Tax=Otariodibacter oris TaxID=1032623 RepID=A0A420XGP9_9PAST|nr:MalM family protein [Otariodibacter oris]QGM81160.1 maltose operon protein MalM [Otariodibacter oris]RKR72713.1 maltose operon protein [Otariodibacter oris]